MMTNEMIVNVRIKRSDLCNLILACTAAYGDTGAKKWDQLYDKLKMILDKFDEEHGIGVYKQ